jgi:hypothetical protein
MCTVDEMSLNKMIDTRTEHSRAIVNPRAHWPASLAILRVSGSMRDTVSKLTAEWNRGRHSVSSAGISKLLHEHISTLLEHVRTHRPHIRSTNNNTPAFLNLRYYCALLRHKSTVNPLFPITTPELSREALVHCCPSSSKKVRF